MEELVQYRQQDAIAHIVLNRPEKLNAFSDDMSKALADALYRFYDDEAAMVGIVSGNGRAFCSGADVKQRQLRPEAELKKLGGPAGREGDIRPPFFKPPMGKPLIAAMHGYVYGAGLRIALYCDMTVAAKGTKFQVTEVARGVNGVPFWMMQTSSAGCGSQRRRWAITRSTAWPSPASTLQRPRSSRARSLPCRRSRCERSSRPVARRWRRSTSRPTLCARATCT